MTTETAILNPGDKVRLHLTQFIAIEKHLASREVEGVVERATAKAVKLTGSCVVRESDQCLRCGREIDNPVSRLAGYGPICSEKLGIPRDFTPGQIVAIREAVKLQTRMDMWLPLGQVQILAHERANVVTHVPEAARPSVSAPGASVATPEPPAVTIRVDADALLVSARFEHLERCKSVPGGRWDKERKAWRYSATPATIDSIRHAFRGVLVDVDEGVRALARQADAIRGAAVHKTADALPDVPVTAKSAWLHQRRAYHFAEKLPSVMLAMKMGTGKSKVVVDLVVNLNERRVLVVCPNSVVGVWPKEFAKHAGRPVHVQALIRRAEDGHIIDVSVAEKVEIAKRAITRAEAMGAPIVIVVNYETAWREPFAAWALSQQWDRVIFDEIHRIKAPGGKASMYCARLGRKANRRAGLTGTPMPHSPLDVYGQFRALDPGIYGTSFTAFRNRYAVLEKRKGSSGWFDEVTGYKNETELMARFNSISFQVGKEVLDLPPEVFDTRECVLSAEGRRVYRELASSFMAQLKEGTVVASNALAKLLRLQQITSGFVVTEDGEERQVDTAKESLLEDVLEDLDAREPVVVACRFRHDLDVVKRVTERLGRRYGELSGRRSDLTPEATMPTNVDVLGVQIQAGGVGIDLTRAAYCINYSLGFSLGDYEQWLARVHRPGQTRTTTYITLQAAGTVDVKVSDVLANRKSVVETILKEGLGHD